MAYSEIATALDCDVWEMVGRSLSLLWKDWPRDMQVSSFVNAGFILNGTCPHCGKQAAFVPVTQAYEELRGNSPYRTAEVARCVACNDYILAICKYEQIGRAQGRWVYEAHYPLGRPDDKVADEIPPEIKPDFQEALRCRWVNAYDATAEMCRRALEASCLQLGAPEDKVLSMMIDWVHKQGLITTLLQQMAHKIKLGGNRGAHPSDGTVMREDADAILEFTKEYFRHVYVMPARIAKFDLDKAKKKP